MSKAEEILKDSIEECDLIHTGYEIVFKKECVLRAMEAYHQSRVNAETKVLKVQLTYIRL